MSIKKIAQMTGASPATVSRVLNNPNYKCSKEGLREEIWKAAMDLNYTPNESARRLKMGDGAAKTTYVIDILMTRLDGVHSDPFFKELLRYVETQLHMKGCALSRVWYKTTFSDDERCKKENMDAIFADMFANETESQNGLIIIGRCNADVIKRLKKHYRHIVSINRNSTNYEIDEVICDGKKIASMAVEHLISTGNKKIGYIGKCQGEARYAGYRQMLALNKIEFDEQFVIETEQTEDEGYKAMQTFMQSNNRPDGIYCANDITAIGALKCIERFSNFNYRPDIIASDDIEEAQNTKPMLSTVKLPKENMAKFAINLLLDRIQGGHTEVVRVELEGTLLVRSSCKV